MADAARPSMRWLALLAALVVACTTPTTPSPSATAAERTLGPSSTAPASATAPALTTSPARPAAPTLALTGDITARATPVDGQAFRYVAGVEGSVGRVFVVDTARATVTDVVAVRTDGTSPDFSWSLDGRFLLVSGSGPTRHAALYLVDVDNGRTQLLYEDVSLQAPGALGGKISASGARYAFATQHDVRVGDTSGGPPRLLAAHDDPNRVGGTWRPVGWSSDERWVALARASEAESEIAIVDTTTNAIRRLGVGTQVAWRPRRPMPAPELVAAAGASLFGGSTALYTYDIAGDRRSVLISGGPLRIGALAWHPSEDRFLYTAGQVGPPGDDVFTWRLGDGAATRVVSARKVVDAWWSFDGSKIYGLGIRQDAAAPGGANYEVFDLASGLIIATVCRGDPRAACP